MPYETKHLIMISATYGDGSFLYRDNIDIELLHDGTESNRQMKGTSLNCRPMLSFHSFFRML